MWQTIRLKHFHFFPLRQNLESLETLKSTNDLNSSRYLNSCIPVSSQLVSSFKDLIKRISLDKEDLIENSFNLIAALELCNPKTPKCIYFDLYLCLVSSLYVTTSLISFIKISIEFFKIEQKCSNRKSFFLLLVAKPWFYRRFEKVLV